MVRNHSFPLTDSFQFPCTATLWHQTGPFVVFRERRLASSNLPKKTIQDRDKRSPFSSRRSTLGPTSYFAPLRLCWRFDLWTQFSTMGREVNSGIRLGLEPRSNCAARSMSGGAMRKLHQSALSACQCPVWAFRQTLQSLLSAHSCPW